MASGFRNAWLSSRGSLYSWDEGWLLMTCQSFPVATEKLAKIFFPNSPWRNGWPQCPGPATNHAADIVLLHKNCGCWCNLRHFGNIVYIIYTQNARKIPTSEPKTSCFRLPSTKSHKKVGPVKEQTQMICQLRIASRTRMLTRISLGPLAFFQRTGNSAVTPLLTIQKSAAVLAPIQHLQSVNPKS